MVKNRFLEIVEDIDAYLSFISDIGCTSVECSDKSIETLTLWDKEKQFDGLKSIKIELGDCKRCNLSQTRSNILFGTGRYDAKLMFVGGWPDSKEDQEGSLLKSEQGELLKNIIKAMRIDIESVYITNIIKCCPSENRKPLNQEVRACFPFLQKQIIVINPQIICCMGQLASSCLLDTNAPIEHLRGNFYNYMGIQVMPIFDMAYLIQNPSKKRETWEDIKKIMVAMSINRK